MRTIGHSSGNIVGSSCASQFNLFLESIEILHPMGSEESPPILGMHSSTGNGNGRAEPEPAMEGRSAFVPTTSSMGPHDVLLGRSVMHSYPANATFRSFCHDHMHSVQDQMEFGLKMEFCRQVYNKWKELDPPGRFLKFQPDRGWVELSENEALKKVVNTWSNLERGRIRSSIPDFARVSAATSGSTSIETQKHPLRAEATVNNEERSSTDSLKSESHSASDATANNTASHQSNRPPSSSVMTKAGRTRKKDQREQVNKKSKTSHDVADTQDFETTSLTFAASQPKQSGGGENSMHASLTMPHRLRFAPGPYIPPLMAQQQSYGLVPAFTQSGQMIYVDPYSIAMGVPPASVTTRVLSASTVGVGTTRVTVNPSGSQVHGAHFDREMDPLSYRASSFPGAFVDPSGYTQGRVPSFGRDADQRVHRAAYSGALVYPASLPGTARYPEGVPAVSKNSADRVELMRQASQPLKLTPTGYARAGPRSGDKNATRLFE